MAELYFKIDTKTGKPRVTDEHNKDAPVTWHDGSRQSLKSVAKKQGIDLDLDKWKIMLYRHGSKTCYWYDRRLV